MYVTWFYESVDARKNYVFPSQMLNINFYFVPLGINFLELIFSNKVSATTFPFLYKSLFIFTKKLDKIIKNELIHNVKFISILLSLFPSSKYYLFCSNIINRKKKKKKRSHNCEKYFETTFLIFNFIKIRIHCILFIIQFKGNALRISDRAFH